MKGCKVCDDRKKVIDSLWSFKCSCCKNSFAKENLRKPFELQKENDELRETIRKLKGMVNYILAAEKISNNLMNNMTEPVELIIGKKN